MTPEHAIILAVKDAIGHIPILPHTMALREQVRRALKDMVEKHGEPETEGEPLAYPLRVPVRITV